MEMIEVLVLSIGAIAVLLLLRQVLMKKAQKTSDIKALYRKIILSEEYKVKGRFED
ncbi:MAG: hypothetical protein KKE20_04415 [Nanoarchaeota archaeon]|nr:hypothetical protein [Nanoarchaeota archaeon]